LYAQERGFDHLIPEKWYSQSKKQITARKVGEKGKKGREKGKRKKRKEKENTIRNPKNR
jgi:hypothetical protein